MPTTHAERRQPIKLRETTGTQPTGISRSRSFETTVPLPFGKSRSLQIELNPFVANPLTGETTSYWVGIKWERGKKPVLYKQSGILKHSPGSDIGDEVIQLIEKEHISLVDKFLRSFKL